MRKTKRWLLIFAALVGLLAHAGALRATALIFGKVPTSSTTTTTTTESSSAVGADEQTTEIITPSENNTSTKPTLTGIPQIDYIWDPNLPRELNGYNLSDYPFYNSVPPNEEIDFKCDGLHDGFYASVKHKCQLYHHCLFGIRYDFLCANFTAFDQKTFICHFVSEVDCKNSPKYYHRNDALYKTTTSSTTSTTTPAPPPTAAPAIPVGSGGDRPRRPHRRPPPRRRRPVDYYYYDDDYDDEYYEERMNRRRKQRPRTRRPNYEDDYDDRRGYRDDDDGYDKRPYNRDRSMEEDEDYDYDRRRSGRPRNRNRPGDNRRINEDDRSERGERRKYNDRRRAGDDRRPPADERRPNNADRRYNVDDRRSLSDDRYYKNERGRVPDSESNDSDYRRNNSRRRLNGDRRSTYNDDDRPLKRTGDEDASSYETKKTDKDEEKSVVKPSGSGGGLSSLFSGPRAPPKISRPVPLNEKKKYEYTTKKTTTTTTSNNDEDYYDEYDDEQTAKLPEKRDKPEKTAPSSTLQRDYNKRPFTAVIKEDPRTRYETIHESDKTVDNSDSRQSLRNKYKPVGKTEYKNDSSRDEVSEDVVPRFRYKTRDDVDKSDEEFEDVRPQKPKYKPNESEITSTPRTKYKPIDKNGYRGLPRRGPMSTSEEENNKSRSTPIRQKDEGNDDSDIVSKYKNFERNGPRSYVRDPESSEDEDYKPRLRESARNPPLNKSSKDRDSGEELGGGNEPRQYKEQQRNRQFAKEETDSPSNKNEENEKTLSEEEPIREVRPIVRIVKRPFLPSRGGSPYLPRGLQPVGDAQKPQTTESSPIDMGSTISGVRLLEHAPPLVRESFDNSDDYPESHKGPRTTQQPQIDPPKLALDEIYDNEYDVTLNDALNPTIKPLTPNHSYQPTGFSQQINYDNSQISSPSGYSDSLYSPTAVRSSAVQSPSSSTTQENNSNSSQYYDDYYDY